MQRAAVDISDSLDGHKQLNSRNSKYNAWIIVHDRYWILLLTIFFNTESITSLHYGTKDQGKWFKNNGRYTETISWLSSHMIAINHGINVIHYFSHLIRANQRRNAQFINGTMKLVAPLCISWLYVPGKWLILNSNVILPALWYPTKLPWEC